MKKILIPLLLCLSSLGFAAETPNINLPIEVKINETRPAGAEYYEYDFGSLALGTEAEAVFTITNTTKSPLTFTDAIIDGDYFYGEHSCSGGLKPKEECYVVIHYSPEARGNHTGAFEMSFSPNIILHVDLYGNAY